MKNDVLQNETYKRTIYMNILFYITSMSELSSRKLLPVQLRASYGTEIRVPARHTSLEHRCGLSTEWMGNSKLPYSLPFLGASFYIQDHLLFLQVNTPQFCLKNTTTKPSTFHTQLFIYVSSSSASNSSFYNNLAEAHYDSDSISYQLPLNDQLPSIYSTIK